jgi:hypothetical protein
LFGVLGGGGGGGLGMLPKLPGDDIARSFDPARSGPAGDGDPHCLFAKRLVTRFAVESARGRVEIAIDGLVLDGAPLVFLPRKVKREYALAEEWGLTAQLPDGMWDFEFEEVIIEPGQKVDIQGVIARDGEILRLERARVRGKR